MKTVIRSTGLLLRLGLTAAALLLGQQAMAAGTAVSTPVDNRATVVYSVNTVPQTGIESAPGGNSTPGVNEGADTRFLVDRLVDFELTQVQTALTPVNVSDTQQVVEYLLTNNSNSALDFALSAVNSIDGVNAGHGADDSEDVTILSARVSSKSTNTAPVGPGPDPLITGPTDVISLAADDSIRIFVFSDIPGTLPDASVAVIELSATAAAPGTGAATLLAEVATSDPLTIENVWTGGPVAVGDNYIETELEGYEISSASLTITKTSTVISDPINLTTNPKAIPGAIIEYSIAIAHTGVVGDPDATGIVITDDIATEVTFLDDAYGGGNEVSYDIDGGPASLCDANDATTTDCDLAGATLTVGGTTLALDVQPTETLTVRFRVEIPPVP